MNSFKQDLEGMWLIPASMEASLDDVFVAYLFFLLFLSIGNGGFAIVSSAIKWYSMLAIMTRLRLGPYNPAVGRDAGTDFFMKEANVTFTRIRYAHCDLCVVGVWCVVCASID